MAINFKQIFLALAKENPEEIAKGAKEVAQEAKKQWEGLKGDIAEQWEKVKEAFSGSSTLSIVEKQCEFLKLEEVISIAKANMKAGADSVAIMKQEKDGVIEVWMTYCKEKNMLPENENTYIKIQTDCLARDVKDLFGDNNCVLLN